MTAFRCVIWGIGIYGKKVYRLLTTYYEDVLIDSFIDNNPKYKNTYFDDIPIMSFQEYLSLGRLNATPIVIAVRKFNTIEEDLHKHGITNYFVFEKMHLGPSVECTKDIKRFDDTLHTVVEGILWRDLCVNGWKIMEKLYCSFFLSGCRKENFVAHARVNLIDAKHPVTPFCPDANKAAWSIFLRKPIQDMWLSELPADADLVLIHGLSYGFFTTRLVFEAAIQHISVVYTEDGFIRSIEPENDKTKNVKFYHAHAFVVDYWGLYINAEHPSMLEHLLNSERNLTNHELERAKYLIAKICRNRISKYNHQPICTLDIGIHGRKKVLVIDQVKGDKSIEFGWASMQTFDSMLEAAVRENPDADILVKTHPVGQAERSCFSVLSSYDNIYQIDYLINPICLLEYVDKVYVCTSQMGFEALMCGKEVHVFGMPFYAGWGVTKDRLVCERRKRKRSLEEIFYMAYVMYSIYVSYKTNDVCEIEQALQEIIELRKEYFDSFLDK